MAPRGSLPASPDYPLWTGVEALYVNDYGVVTCNLTCEDGEFLTTLGFRRTTLVEFFTCYTEHLAAYHPCEFDQLKRELPNLLANHGHNPQEQPQSHKVEPARNTDSSDQETHGGRNQQDQNQDRHVDPLNLGRWL